MDTYRQNNFLSEHNSMENLNQVIEPLSFAPDGSVFEDWQGGIHPKGKLEFTKQIVLQPADLSRLMSVLHSDIENRPSYKSLANSLGITAINTEGLVTYSIAMSLVIPRKLQPTSLAHLYKVFDPHFTDPAGNWLFHYLGAGDPRNVIWNYLFNVIFQEKNDVSIEQAREKFKIFSGRWSANTLTNKLRGEIRTFQKTYQEGLYSPLGLLSSTNDDGFSVHIHSRPIPPLVALSCIIIFRDRFYPGATSIEVDRICHGYHSPGRIMLQSERRIRKLLNELHEAKLINLESKANLDQVRFTREQNWLQLIRIYFQDERN